LIIDAIYLDILHGKLDQKEEQLEVTYTMGRDIEPGKLEGVLTALNDWASTTSSVLSALDAKLNVIAAQTVVHKQHQQEYEKQLQANLKEVHDKQKEKSLGSTGGERAGLGRRGTQFDRDRENMMEVDDLDPKGRGRKFVTQDLKPHLRKRNKF
jgi:COP9 signalosome complex subunit 7